MDTPIPVPLDTGSCTLIQDCGSNEYGREEVEARSMELSPEHLAPGAKKPNEITLYQRLIAALIPEDENEGLFCSGKEDLKYNMYESQFEMEKYPGSDTFCPQMSPNCDFGHPTSNGCDVKSNGRSSYELERSVTSVLDTGIPSYDHLQNALHAVCTEYQYQNMSLNERLLMEVHSIGMYPDLVVCYIFSLGRCLTSLFPSILSAFEF